MSVTDVAKSTIDAFKGSPLMLAIIVLNVIMFGAVAYSVRDERAMRVELVKASNEQIKQLITELADCRNGVPAKP